MAAAEALGLAEEAALLLPLLVRVMPLKLGLGEAVAEPPPSPPTPLLALPQALGLTVTLLLGVEDRESVLVCAAE